MAIRYLLVAMMLLLAACDSEEYDEETNTLVIKSHNGGDTDTHIRRYNQLYSDGTTVRIEGFCASSCTFFIGLPKACVAPDAELFFHGSSPRVSLEEAKRQYTEARARGDGHPWREFQTIQDVRDYGDYTLSFVYKPLMRQEFMEVWRHRRGLGGYTFSGEELHTRFPTEVELCS